ncbi:hypothetical protein [Hyphomonas johnsonii]|uniref:Lipoprotein n=1 Tax=Hyphomonas johnsonii MHS-2 TaxID=1280950 RepID=A0A059FMX2_9PROT|nr:hypothetical protein [Hyphomonas johnsonii]KCZ91828.1 hypothetical protein HJO_11942 [Hyphomonas johnsonii MHS-2]
MKRTMLILAAGFALAACASSQHADMSVEEGAQRVCRSVTESGTILPKRICNNKATWAAIDEQNREAAAKTMDDIRSRRGYMDKETKMGN